MLSRRTLFSAALVLSLGLGSGSLACGSDGGNGPGGGVVAALVATWDVTSFVAGGTDLVQSGMGLSMALDNTGGYTLDYTNDQTGNCDPNPDCTNTGAWSATGTKMTFDPGTPDAVTLNYTVQGTTLTLTGTIDITPVLITAEKQ